MNRYAASLVTLLFVFVAGSLTAVHAEGASPAGTWLTEKGDARIQVSRCGKGICGKVVWLQDPINPATGKPHTDDKNPNPKLAKRPMIGVQLFIGMNPTGPDSWAGRIYNADDGGTYDSKVKVTGPSSLRVEGCVGSLCGGETWTRVSGR